MNNTNIIIFDTESLVHDEIITKNEKELFYNNLKKTSKLRNHIDNFYFMDKYEEDNKFIDSTIESVLLKQLIKYITPIIEEPPSINIERKRVGENKDIPKKKIEESKKNIGVLITIDFPTNCELKDGSKIKLASGQDIFVIGFKISQDLDKINVHDFYTYSVINYADIYESGIFGLKDYSIDKYFKFNSNINGSLEFYFTNEKKHNIQILEKTLNIIQNAIRFYETNLGQMYNSVEKYTLVYSIKDKKSTQYNAIKEISNITEQELSIIKKLNSTIGYNFLYSNKKLSLINLFNSGLYDYFYKLQLDTRNKELLDELNYRKVYQQSKGQQIFNKFVKQLELFKKRIISLNKFGTSDILSLNDKQIDIIDKEYKKIIEQKENPIAESEIVIQLYKAIDKEDKKEINSLLDSLNNSIKLPKPAELPTLTTFIKNKKGQNAICPHVVAKADGILNKYKSFMEKNNKMKEILVKFSSLDQEEGLFCKICGEKLIEEESLEMTIDSMENYSSNKYEDTYDTLYFAIYKEIAYIFNNFVEFRNIIFDISKIIRNVVEILKGEIRAVESNIIKVKTLSKENSAVILNIYIYIYAFAFITQLIYTNDSMSFKKTLFKGGKSVIVEKKKTKTVEKDMQTRLKSKIANTESNKRRLQSLMSDAIYLIKRIKYQDIQRSQSLNPDSIKPLFLKAYRWILNVNYTSVESSNENYFIQNTIIDYFIYANNQLAYNKNTEKTGNTGYIEPLFPYSLAIPNDNHFKGLEIVMGRKYDQINKDIPKNVSILHTLNEPKKWNDNVYTNDSIISLYDYIKNELFLENVTEDNAKFKKFYEKYVYIRELEEKNGKEFKKSQLRPFISINTVIHPYPIKKVCVCEQEVFYRKVDKKGKLGPKQKISKDEINKWLEEKNYTKLKEFNSMELFFDECKCEKKDNSIEIFYKYYQEVCPLGELHIFDKEKCSKCGITNEIIEKKDTKFYNKYKDKFEKSRKRKRVDERPVKKIIKLPEFPKWDLNTDNITKFSKKFGVSIIDIYNMGLYEKKDYVEIKTKKTNLSEGLNEDDHIKRNNILFDYYLYTIRNYYILRSSEFSINLPIYLKDFLKKFSNKDIIKKLPVINQDFIDKYKYYKKTIPPKSLTNFLLNSICQLFLDILQIFVDKNLKQMGDKFLDIIYSNISEFDRNTSKFTIKRFVRSSNIEVEENVATKEIDELEDKADDYDDSFLEGEAPVEIEEEEAVEEEPEDIFSLNDMDVEDADEDVLYKDVLDKLS